MREIIFRGKRKDNGEWVYGSLLIQSGEWISKDEQAPTEYRILGCRGENYLAIPETVSQYTGMTDKNGVKVFEGDIVCIFDGEYFSGVVKYSNEQGSFTVDDTSLHYWVSDIEVIGNIHDNFELLNK